MSSLVRFVSCFVRQLKEYRRPQSERTLRMFPLTSHTTGCRLSFLCMYCNGV